MLNDIKLEQAKLKAYTNEELVHMLMTYKDNKHNNSYAALIKELKLRGVEL